MLFGRPLVHITKKGLGLEMQSLGLGLEKVLTTSLLFTDFQSYF